jgi:hypothetical protein
MKLNNLVKALPLVLGAGLAFNASAGVVATSYLEINSLFVELDADKDGVADTSPVGIIQIINGTREGNTNANFNGTSVGNSAVDNTGVGDANAQLVCAGPDCGALALSDNGQSLDLGNLVHDTNQSYAVSDENVTGSAIGGGASGFTYADVGIAGPTNIGSASSQIFNNLLTTLTLNVLADINIRFTALYDMFVDAIITPDITADGSVKATASAEASFNIDLDKIGGPADIFGANGVGISASDFAFDVPGLGDADSFFFNNASFATGWVTLTAGTYQLKIAQDSDVQASVIPEPGVLAIFGIGMLGLSFASRRKFN